MYMPVQVQFLIHLFGTSKNFIYVHASPNIVSYPFVWFFQKNYVLASLICSFLSVCGRSTSRWQRESILKTSHPAVIRDLHVIQVMPF